MNANGLPERARVREHRAVVDERIDPAIEVPEELAAPRPRGRAARYKLFTPQTVRCWPAGTGHALADWLRSRGHEPQFIEWTRR
jgi:hypothetical protein